MTDGYFLPYTYIRKQLFNVWQQQIVPTKFRQGHEHNSSPNLRQSSDGLPKKKLYEGTKNQFGSDFQLYIREHWNATWMIALSYGTLV